LKCRDPDFLELVFGSTTAANGGNRADDAIHRARLRVQDNMNFR
jgi:hypothetical protein